MRRGLQSLKKKEEIIIAENPFVLAIAIFFTAFFINSILDLDFTKNFFAWSRYYIDSAIYWLNSVLQPAFKNHPYIHIPVIVNPVNEQAMAAVNPWMWIRGYILSCFIAGHYLTVLQLKMLPSNKIFKACFIAGLIQFAVYILASDSGFSATLFTETIQKYYINIIVLLVGCFISFLSGQEYALYLLRNDKIQLKNKLDERNINIKYTDKLDW